MCYTLKRNMFSSMYPFWSFVIAVLVAQGIKPFFAIKSQKGLNWRIVTASGGMPSSHTAGVFSLCLAVGIQESFDSTGFAICLAFGLIVAYDAANVRYYAGKNIQLTKSILEDLKSKNEIVIDEPIYEEPIKEVLGHKWSEVFVGGILGMIVALILYFI